jgi:alpha-L-fucosidase
MRPKPLFRVFPVQALSLALTLPTLNAFAALPPLPPFPSLPAPQPVDSVPMADSKSAPEVKLDLPITPGPYAPTWESIEKNYPGTPAWLRDAKFGIWVHFGPQAAGQSGDWYARNLYKPGSTAYKNHLANYGHPSEVGYKEVLRDWNPDKLDPAKLVELYKDAGARYLIIQGVHHDEFDMWDSKYQPWNSTRLGPKRDLLGEWTKAARAADIRFGVTFHHEYSWWWWQTAFGSDKDGPKAGIPYDGHLTLADGKGKWWEGLDPRLLYGVDLREYKGVVGAANHAWNPPPAGIFQNHAAYAKWYATWWALRMMDVVDKYQPDFIYTDGTNTQPFSGAGTGTGQKSDAMQRVIADFYNKTLQRRGKVDVFSIVKFRPKTNGTVNTEEGGIPRGIKSDQDWIAETPVGDWFYAPGFTNDSGAVIRYLLEEVSRDGNVGLCICPLPDGSLDNSTIKMLKETGEWMRINGSGIYGSKAWTRLGEGANGKLNVLPGGKIGERQAAHKFAASDIRFTVGKDKNLYAYCMTVPATGTELRINSLGSSANALGAPVKSVSLLGYSGSLIWKQEADALVVTLPDTSAFKTALGFKIETK